MKIMSLFEKNINFLLTFSGRRGSVSVLHKKRLFFKKEPFMMESTTVSRRRTCKIRRRS